MRKMQDQSLVVPSAIYPFPGESIYLSMTPPAASKSFQLNLFLRHWAKPTQYWVGVNGGAIYNLYLPKPLAFSNFFLS